MIREFDILDNNMTIKVTIDGYYGEGTMLQHITETEVHGAQGAVVGTENEQTLTNKTLESAILTGDTQIASGAQDKVGFFGVNPVDQPGVYLLTQYQNLRQKDTTNITIDELTDLVCTMVEDLLKVGIFG